MCLPYELMLKLNSIQMVHKSTTIHHLKCLACASIMYTYSRKFFASRHEIYKRFFPFSCICILCSRKNRAGRVDTMAQLKRQKDFIYVCVFFVFLLEIYTREHYIFGVYGGDSTFAIFGSYSYVVHVRQV